MISSIKGPAQPLVDAPLLDAGEVGRLLGVHQKRVYGLAIRQVRLSARRVRWRLSDVQAFIDGKSVAA